VERPEPYINRPRVRGSSTAFPFVTILALHRVTSIPLSQFVASFWMQSRIGEPRDLRSTYRRMLTDFATAARLWLPCVLLLHLTVQVSAVRLDQCRAKFANETSQSGPTNITYNQCVETCGGGAGEFKWTMFSQGFSAWLLPWIALIFQLPFGAIGQWPLT
jgi:hypothetical protein